MAKQIGGNYKLTSLENDDLEDYMKKYLSPNGVTEDGTKDGRPLTKPKALVYAAMEAVRAWKLGIEIPKDIEEAITLQSSDNLPDDPVTELSLYGIDKLKKKEFIDGYVAAVDAGEISIDEMFKHLEAISAFNTVFLDNKTGLLKYIKNQILDKVSDSELKDKYIGNFEVSKSQSASYDYSNDPVIQDIEAELEKVNERLKDRQTFLRGVKAPDALKGEEAQTELRGDELIELRPPIRKSSDVLKVTLKR